MLSAFSSAHPSTSTRAHAVAWSISLSVAPGWRVIARPLPLKIRLHPESRPARPARLAATLDQHDGRSLLRVEVRQGLRPAERSMPLPAHWTLAIIQGRAPLGRARRYDGRLLRRSRQLCKSRQPWLKQASRRLLPV